jgi:crossover junction endodeoxyribonuclease RusA
VPLTWFANTRHRRDADNVVPTLKAACDGLVDAGVVLTTSRT